MNYIDLRSDTVTQPTPEMREAMAAAEVGDDVYGDDPTVNQLQERAAGMLGMEASLFVPSGTMGNLIALMAHCSRGEEVICGDKSHIYLNEAGGMAALGGIYPHPIPNQRDGTIQFEDIRASIQPDDSHRAVTKLLCLENTQNVCGGVPLTVEYTRQAGQLAKENGLKFHIDGARIFNAAAALDVEVKELAAPADSVMFCLSKGLAAPVGSMLAGTREFIARAHRLRKMLGGGMRQAGVVAAAGLISLEKMTGRLKQDHARARNLYEALKQIPGLRLEAQPSTNMAYFTLAESIRLTERQIIEEMKNLGVLVDWSAPREFRLVTHYWVDDAGVERAARALGQVLRSAAVGE